MTDNSCQPNRRSPAVRLPVVCLLVAFLAGCGQEAEPDAVPSVVLIDTATNTAAVYSVTENYPAIHPATGKATLVPAMHCAVCRRWWPVPTPDQINRVPDATRCPECRGQLSPDGPLPQPRSADS